MGKNSDCVNVSVDVIKLVLAITFTLQVTNHTVDTYSTTVSVFHTHFIMKGDQSTKNANLI